MQFKTNRSTLLFYIMIPIIVLFTILVGVFNATEQERKRTQNPTIIVYYKEYTSSDFPITIKAPYTWANAYVIFDAKLINVTDPNKDTATIQVYDPRTVPDYTTICIFNRSPLKLRIMNGDTIIPQIATIKSVLDYTISPSNGAVFQNDIVRFDKPNGFSPIGQLLYEEYKLYDRMWEYAGSFNFSGLPIDSTQTKICSYEISYIKNLIKYGFNGGFTDSPSLTNYHIDNLIPDPVDGNPLAVSCPYDGTIPI